MKWFSREKGWGFIQLESGEDIFVHHSDIEGEGFVTLEDDQPVEFSVEEMEKGPRARNVREIGAEAPSPKADATRSDAGERVAAGGRERKELSERPPRSERPERQEPDRERQPGGRRPLAEQLRERLARHFPGLDG